MPTSEAYSLKKLSKTLLDIDWPIDKLAFAEDDGILFDRHLIPGSSSFPDIASRSDASMRAAQQR
jgi:hypothetical protein